MIVLRGFTEYEGKKRVHRNKGEEITATGEQADRLRKAGLVRAKPKQKDTGNED
jgi:hypothetical protein